MQRFFSMKAIGGGMVSKGLRVIFCQVTRKVEAGYKPSFTIILISCILIRAVSPSISEPPYM
ncbi:MAG: hypothetical protein K1X55_05625 [Chitinophagales bacterium]|nr:hypothetical protein [Chitinophagales bacterium]